MKDKFNLIFLIGLEGSGHNFFKECCNIKEENPLHNLIFDYFNSSDLKNKNLLEHSIYEYTKQNIGKNHMERTSFPYGTFNQYNVLYNNAICYYDILEFYNLFNSMEHINLFFLVNTRDIIESSISTITRFNYPVIYSAKMQENSLIYINSQMQLIPKNKYIIVDFKNLINNVKSFEKIFQEKANINISFNSDKIKQIYHSEYLINIHYNHLKTYFNTIRLQQFNFLRDNICII
jgi:hypothetical protein|tara:strand:+ start:591 stop:1292 length:702 start_codon:yes stop_codon:yes gene_type:complete